jgi:hypothetical protein
MVQQGVSRDEHSEILQQASSRFSTESEGDTPQPFGESLCLTDVVRDNSRQAFREDLPRARILVAEESFGVKA